MPTYFDESDFLQDTQPQVTPVEIDPATFVESDSLPYYANGAQPNTPINESPVNIQDRLKLSVGNETGKIKFLKDNYGEVQKTREGDFVIKGQDGLWRRVDAQGLGESDPWKMTKDLVAGIGEAGSLMSLPGIIASALKGGPEFRGVSKEIASDIVENIPLATSVGAQIGAAALTSGASLGAQAATAGGAGAMQKGLETILGRAVGTYQAAEQEQMQDIAIETLLNAGGVYVGAGIQAGIPYIAKGLQKAGETLQKINPISRDTFSSLIGMNVKGGQVAVDQLISKPAEVSSLLNEAAKVTNSSTEAVAYLNRMGADHARELAKAAQPALNNMYDVGKREVLREIPQNFNPEIVKTIESMQQKFIDAGVARYSEPTVKAGKGLIQSIEFKTLEELTKEASSSGKISPYLSDPDSYAVLEKMFNNLKSYANVKELKGIAGADQLLAIKKNLNNASQELFQSARDAGQTNAKNFMASLKGTFDAAIYPKFELKVPAKTMLGESGTTNNLLVNLDSVYSAAKKDLQPLFNSVKLSQNNPEVWNTLYNQLTSQVGSNQGKKLAFEKSADYLSRFGGKEGVQIAQNFDRIKSINSASSFTPNIKQSILSTIASAGAVGAAISGNLGAAVPMATAGVMTSPKVNYHAIKSFLATKAFLGNLPATSRMQFLNNPQAVTQWAQTPVASQVLKQQVGTQLLNQGLQVVQPRLGQGR